MNLFDSILFNELVKSGEITAEICKEMGGYCEEYCRVCPECRFEKNPKKERIFMR